MNAIERRIDELEQYVPPLTAPADLDAFWERNLQKFKTKPLNDRLEKVHTPLDTDVYKVIYEGFDDTPIHGWHIVPKRAVQKPVPCIVHFHGYAGSKGYPEHYASWILMGMAVFAVDVRGQGGETGNYLGGAFGMAKGWVSQGILNKEQSYYMATIIDSLKAVEWAAKQPHIDPAQIYVYGASQGTDI